MKKKLLLLLFFFLTSCNSIDTYNLTKCPKETSEIIMSFDYFTNHKAYDYNLTLNYFWDGYCENNSFSHNCSAEDRFNTYLIDIEENIDNFHLVYVKSSFMNKIEDFCKNKTGEQDPGIYSIYSSMSCIIDGKQLGAAISLGINSNKFKFFDANVFQTSFPYKLNGYTLIGALFSKRVVIEENLTTQEVLNKADIFFCIIPMIKDGDVACWYIPDGKGQLFNYQGTYIVPLSNCFLDKSNYLFPNICLDKEGDRLTTPLCRVLDDKILLPRYLKSNDNIYDLFTMKTTDGLNEYPGNDVECDLYKDYKNFFNNIFIKDSTIEDEYFRYGWFDYNQFKELIKIK